MHSSDSYLLKVVTENTDSLDHLISESMRTITGVTRTHTTIVMSSVKEGSQIKPAVDLSRKAIEETPVEVN